MSLDDFRRDADAYNFDDEETEEQPQETLRRVHRTRGNFLGMSPAQRFVIVLMLLVVTCLVGSLCLLATGRIVPPGF